MHVEVMGEQIAYVESGGGEAILFLHSLGASKVIWERQIGHLAGRYRCIAADAPGHGASTRREPIDGERIVEAHVALLDALGVDRAHVVGVSMGGCWAMQMWRAHARRIRSLVLCDTFASMADPEAPVRARAETLAAMEMDAFGREYAQAVFKGAPTEQARRDLADAVAQCSKEAYLETARACYASNAEDLLARIAVPTLVITGALDDRILPTHSEHIAARIPGARLAVIPGAGHLPQLDNPAAFDAVLDAFYASL